MKYAPTKKNNNKIKITIRFIFIHFPSFFRYTPEPTLYFFIPFQSDRVWNQLHSILDYFPIICSASQVGIWKMIWTGWKLQPPFNIWILSTGINWIISYKYFYYFFLLLNLNLFGWLFFPLYTKKNW